MSDPINSTSAASLPVVAWRYRWKAPREALTPHAPAQAQIDALRIENERLSRELAEALLSISAGARAHLIQERDTLQRELAALKAGKEPRHD